MNGQQPPPPPPPPHGQNNARTNQNQNSHNAKPNDSSQSRSGGLPPGNYDIFVIPPHSSGSGFLYLPSLQVNRNSFLAGAVCALAVVGIWVVVIPVLKQWTQTMAQSGGAGMILLISGVGVLGWAYGKTQGENASDGKGDKGGTNGGSSSNQGQQQYQGHAGFQPPPNGAGFQSGPGGFGNGSSSYTGAGASSGWQRPFGSANASASAGWQKAREETKRREDERKQKEEAEKRAKAAAEQQKWAQARAREKEARERLEKLRREREAKEKVQEQAAKEAEERVRKDASAHSSPKRAADASSGRYHKPTAQTEVGEEDAHSFRPYDTPKKHPAKTASQSSIFSETPSWAGSHSTARTTPPPSQRGPYSTKDPDKIVIRAVYAFADNFQKPVAQLVSGQGHITDGLILKMTTEGLFVDDDVRGVGQREWDVKAWTMKLVEVWCPSLTAKAGPAAPIRYIKKDPLQRFVAGSNGLKSALNEEETDAVIVELMDTCRTSCGSKYGFPSSNNSRSAQTGDIKGKYHVVRASIRDAENKRYVFVVPDAEAWKVAVGLQRLRRGSQVRSLGVSGLSANETKAILNSLGWS